MSTSLTTITSSGRASGTIPLAPTTASSDATLLASRIASAARQTFVHGTTMGPRGRFPEAKQGLVFTVQSHFFVGCPEDRVLAAQFAARRPSAGTPVILTVTPVDPEDVKKMQFCEMHSTSFFPAGIQLHIDNIETIDPSTVEWRSTTNHSTGHNHWL